jgi:hypothetical protein
VSEFLRNLKVAANINIRIPEEGEKIKRLVEIAKERNIDYKPSSEALASLRDYCDRKGLENPLGGGPRAVVIDNNMPAPYNPAAAGLDFSQPAYQPQVHPPVVNYMPDQTAGYNPQAFVPPPQQPPPITAYTVFQPQNMVQPPPMVHYPLYDPGHQEPPAASNDIDDFQAKLDSLKKL